MDASVRIQGEDRAGVERLIRYCARPRPSRWNGSTPPVATSPSAHPSLSSSIDCPSRRPTAAPSSCSLRFSSSSGWLASFHPRAYIGIGITGCSLPIPSSVPPSLTSAGPKSQHPEPSSYAPSAQRRAARRRSMLSQLQKLLSLGYIAGSAVTSYTMRRTTNRSSTQTGQGL